MRIFCARIPNAQRAAESSGLPAGKTVRPLPHAERQWQRHVIAAAEGGIGDPYPVEPFELVIEILSPEDSFSRVLRKCRLYEKWGIRQVVVVDPQARLIWSFENGSPRETDTIAKRGERAILARELWGEVDRQLRTAAQ